VITDIRLGPASAISGNTSTKASAEQTNPSTAIDASASVGGVSVGAPSRPNGSSSTDASASATATGPIGLPSLKWRLTIIGPIA
jgi:hypothetical protein